MKRSKRKGPIAIALLLFAVILLTSITAISISANERADAMTDIRAAFDERYKVGESYLLEDDGYIGIEVELTTYYDKDSFGAATPVLGGTNIALYFVNTNTERVGRESDVNIISDLLSRGFAVVTVDYLGNSRASGSALDWSSQEVRKSIIDGSCFTDKTVFPEGTYKDTYVLPAGYNVTPFATFWSIDEHGADGTLERIVEVWNNDFRGVKGNVVVNWTRTETDAFGNEYTVQKPTQTGLDGTEPQWYSDASGKTPVDKDSPDAKYIKIKHTLAQTVTDCTAQDGSPLSLDLDMHIVYPVDPEENVPVIMQSGSSEYLTTGKTGDDTRPQHNGYLFRGYAAVIYDHLYVPMAHNQYYGYFDGSKDASVTGDHASYTLFYTNNTKVDTAAVRYIRYLALTEPEKYSFDVESIGVYGNSKGGMFMFVGSAELREYTDLREGMTLAESIDARINDFETNRYAVGHHGETRYQNGLTEDYTVGGYTIRGGKLQPWTTYIDENGTEREILSYVSYLYVANAGNAHSIKEGHAPIFNVMCLSDPLGNCYSSSNQIAAATKTNNIPSISFVVDVGHTFTYGEDIYYGVDTYEAMFDFSDYYLKGTAVKVIYTDPVVSFADMATSAPITIKFSGAVEGSELDKITLVDSKGNAVEGIIWESCYGNTEWKLIHSGLCGGEEYTLTIPKGFRGDNGTPTEESFVATYRTRAEESLTRSVITTAKGTYITVSGANICASGAKIRFLVENNASNIASVTEVTSFNEANPDASVLGDKIATVNLYGRGVYECDVSDAMSGVAEGNTKTFLLKTDKSAGVFDISHQIFDGTDLNIGNSQFCIVESATVPDGSGMSAVKVHITPNVRADGTSNYVNSLYYPSYYTVMNRSGLFAKITEDDLGRRYTVTLRVYDTVSRDINLRLSSATNESNQILDFDYNYFTVETKANEWTEISFDYTVLAPLYGSTALSTKSLSVHLAGDGDRESPLYISELSVTESVTEAEFSNIGVVLYNDGTSYKAPNADKPFSIGSVYYESLSEALAAAKSADTITMHAGYTESASFTGLEKLEELTLDLSGYKLYLEGSLFTARATVTARGISRVTVKNGAIYIGDSALVSYSGSSSAGSGKSFAFDFENVKFIATDLAMAKKLITESKISGAKNVSVSFDFDGCDFRIEKDALTRNPVTLFPSAEGELDISYTLRGGSISLDTTAWVTLWGFYRNVTVTGDASEHTVINLPTVKTLGEWTVRGESSIFYYTASAQNAGMTVYTTTEYENTTPYGVIPNDYADSEKYPFVVFNEGGEFLGGYSYFAGSNGSGAALEKARTHLSENGYKNGAFADPDATVYIVARRDYTLGSGEYFNNMAQIQGTLVVDLQGHTLSQGSCSAPFFKLASKGWSSAAGEKIFPVTVRVIDGTFELTKTGVMSMDTWDSTGNGAIADKEMNISFSRVTFRLGSNATTTKLIANYNNATSTSVAAKFGVELTDCIFDLATVAPSGALTLFDTNTAGKYIDVDYRINGGKILGGAFNSITVASTVGSYSSSAVFGTGTDGEYTSITVDKGVKVSTGNYSTPTGEVLGYSLVASTEDSDVYKLGKNELVTKYGIISEEYADIDQYPFAIFDGNGNFEGAFGIWAASSNSALSKVYNLLKNNVWDESLGAYTNNGAEGKTAVIYLRRDYTMGESDTGFSNFGYILGEFTVDLGGHTLSQGSSSSYVFSIEAKGKTPTSLTVKNGTVLATTKRIVYVYSSTEAGKAGKKTEVSFDTVTFGLAEGSTIGGLFFSSKSGSTVVSTFNITYNNCIFDYETNPATKSHTIFPDAANKYRVTVTVNGGEFRLGSCTKVNIFASSYTNGSTITFGKYNGNYTALTLDGTEITTKGFNTAEGEMKFVKVSEGNYILASVANPYGADIPQEYGYAEKYPFIVLDQNGSFLAAYDTLYGSNSGMAGKICYTHLGDNEWDAQSGSWSGTTTGCIVLMRRDYTLGSAEYFNNWAAARGTVTIDLGGYTLLQTKDARSDALLKLTGKSADGDIFPVAIVIKNGKISMYKSTVLAMDCYSTSADIGNKAYTVTFDGVTFTLSSGATVSNLLLNAGSTDKGGELVPFTVTYNACEFDLVTNANGKVMKLFNNNATASKYVKCAVSVNGGVIRANTAELVEFWTLSDSVNSSVIFGKYNGEYVKLILTAGASAPNTVFPTTEGEYAFLKTGAENETSIFELGPKDVAKIDFVPKMSLTLDRDLILNVYIPAKDFLVGFTLDGKASTEYEPEEVTLDGELFYRVSVPLNASEACRSITLVAEVNVNGVTASGRFSFGVIKYAQKVLEGSFDIEKQLVMDVLSYIRAAYAYFNITDTESIDKIDAILGEGYDEENMPELDGSAEANVSELKSARLVLDATPSIRFALPDGADASRYAFYIDGVMVATEIAPDGSYIDLDVYAYALCETVTYTVDGEECGSYHLRAYYEWSKSQDYEGLESLVARFAKYCESASAYRDYCLSEV